MLLYLHFPFCRQKCRYCAFYSAPGTPEQIQTWLALVQKEAEIWGQRLGHPELEGVYFGGGTPSLLEPRQIAALTRTIAQAFAWPAGIEWTLEANPESLQDWAKVQALSQLGVNRLSLGVQSLDDSELSMLGRVHDASQARHSVALAQEAGLTNINLDLLWALPGQGLDAWLKNLQSALCLGPRHLSCYALTPEPGTALYRDLGSQDLPAQPRQTVQAAMYAQGVRLIAQSGLRQYEIANFAAPGSYCRHNWGYWQGRPYLGLGPAAVSTLDHRRWENPHSLKSYARAISEQTLGQPAQALTRHEQLQETLMLRLRTTPGLDRLAFKQRFGLDPVSECKPLIAELQGQGLLEFDAQTLRLSDQGLILSDSILASLFAALAPRDHFCLGRSQTSPGSPNKQDRWPGLQDCQDQTNESE